MPEPKPPLMHVAELKEELLDMPDNGLILVHVEGADGEDRKAFLGRRDISISESKKTGRLIFHLMVAFDG